MSTEQADDASMCHNGCAMSSLLHAGHQWPGPIPELLEDMSPAEAKAVVALIKGFGANSLRALLDGTLQARRSALLYMEQVLQGADGSEFPQGDLFNALSRLLQDSLEINMHAKVILATQQVYCWCDSYYDYSIPCHMLRPCGPLTCHGAVHGMQAVSCTWAPKCNCTS